MVLDATPIVSNEGEYAMTEATSNLSILPLKPEDPLMQILREGAQKLLRQAIEAEVDAYIELHQNQKDERGRRLVVRNGHHPERDIQTPLGGLPIRKPKVNDKRLDESGQRIRFTSKILPPYLKKTKNMEELIPWLYLKGISSGDMSEALEALLGKNAKGLSASTVTRLKCAWWDDYQNWQKRSLEGKKFVYIWADGIHIRMFLRRVSYLIVFMRPTTMERIVPTQMKAK